MKGEHTVQIPDAWLVPTVADRDALAWSPGRYRLCFEVANGGMATVYLALYQGPIGFERVVALKTIHPHLAKEKQFIHMFLDEARIAAHIDHPFVCKVVDFGEARDSYYLAMEYLVGEPLSAIWERLNEEPALAASPELPFVLARVCADICEGLHAAHELTSGGRPMEIVHRDVSPANLFVLYDGTARVVDFGIAKAQNKLSHTETGTLKGKYAYLSPEQLSLKELDRRSDVFSLGVVMWEMLTGRRLFKHDAPMETMNRVMKMNIAPPSAIRERIPAELDDIVLRALARRRSDRFPSARVMANALEAFLGGHGRTGTRAEVAEWLDDLFPGELARKRKLVELTRAGDTAVPAIDARLEAPTGAYGGMEATNVRPSRSQKPKVTEAVVVDESAGRYEEGPTLVEGDAVESLDDEDETNERIAAREDTDVERKPTAPTKPMRIDEADAVRRRPPPRRSRIPLVLGGAIAIGAGIGAAWYTTDGPGSRRETVAQPAQPRERTQAPPAPEPPAGEEPPRVAEAPPLSPLPEWVGPSDDVGEPPAGEGGRVHVDARGGGWGDLYYDGHRVGRTGEPITLPVGQKRLVLRPHGDESRERSLSADVRADRTVYLNVTIRAE